MQKTVAHLLIKYYYKRNSLDKRGTAAYMQIGLCHVKGRRNIISGKEEKR